jgi:hypothetical protein
MRSSLPRFSGRRMGSSLSWRKIGHSVLEGVVTIRQRRPLCLRHSLGCLFVVGRHTLTIVRDGSIGKSLLRRAA